MRNNIIAFEADEPFVQIGFAKSQAHFEIRLTVFDVVTNFVDLRVDHVDLVSDVLAVGLCALESRVVAHRVLLEGPAELVHLPFIPLPLRLSVLADIGFSN